MQTRMISAFKAHISEDLRRVRQGEVILLLDRDIPVATVNPISDRGALNIRSAQGKFRAPQCGIQVSIDPLDFLAEDRQSR